MTVPYSAKSPPDEVLAKLRARPSFDQDFTTPEGAILCLEDACRRHSLESVLVCKDFLIEGTVMLLNYDPDLARDAELRKKNAVLAERAFRRRLTEDWPDFTGVESFFFGHRPYAEGIVVVREIQRLPDGSFNQLNVLVAKTKDGWRVLDEISDDEAEE